MRPICGVSSCATRSRTGVRSPRCSSLPCIWTTYATNLSPAFSTTPLGEPRLAEQPRARAHEAAGGPDVREADAEQRGAAGEQPVGERERHAGERGGPDLRPPPAPEPVVEDVRDGAGDEARGRPQPRSHAALQEAAEERLLD